MTIADRFTQARLLRARVRELFGPRAREYREDALESEIVDLFSGAGVPVRRQVRCGRAGRADIVTPSLIVEAKDVLTRPTLQQALRQLQLYSRVLNPLARLAIACNRSKLPDARELLRPLGVGLFVRKEGELALLLNPPYATG